MQVVNLPSPRRLTLGAEELLELGQVVPAMSPVTTIPLTTMPSTAAPRTVAVSREEGELIIHVVAKIVAFIKSFPIEFHAYCPADRWQETLVQVGTWTKEIERQLHAGAQTVVVPAQAIFRLVDLEKCISAARDTRLTAAKIAFGLSATGAIADLVFGLSWVAVPAYIAGIAVLFGGPILAAVSAEPQEPYKPHIAGCKGKVKLAGCPTPKETEEQKLQVKLLERVILSPERGTKKFYWGDVDCTPGDIESSICLRKGRFRVRVEGWAGDIVVPTEGWAFADDCGNALNEVGVWEADGPPRLTSFGKLWAMSRHEETYWVEYVGPNTQGRIRRAGPFGCQWDTRDHALEDGGITKPGLDGDLVLFEPSGEVVELEDAEAVA